MAVNFSERLYAVAFAVFARPITIDPIKSQPGHAPYSARGIYGTDPIDVSSMEGAIVSEQKTIIDLREADFTVAPVQLDRITIPADGDAGKALGTFEITDVDTNGQGELTLSLRALGSAKP